MQVFIAVIMEKLTNSAIEKDLNSFKFMTLFCVSYFLVLSVTNFLDSLVQSKYLRKTMLYLRIDVFRGILSRDYQKFNSQNTGDYISNLTNDIGLIEMNYIAPIMMLIGEMVVFVVSVALLLRVNLMVTVTLLVASILMLLIPTIYIKPIRQNQNLLSSTLGSFTKGIKEVLLGHEVIKSFALDEKVKDEFHNDSKQLEEVKFKINFIKALSNGTGMLLAYFCQFSGIMVAGYFVIKGELTAGTLVAVMQLGTGVFAPTQSLVQKFTTIKSMKSINKKINSIITEYDDAQEGLDITSLDKSITLQDVGFCYDEGKDILENINLTFEKNKKYAILGESGCGKTTLIKLILGYYKQYNGCIKIDGVEINHVKKNSLAKLIAIIHQHIFMFDKSIKDNIILSKNMNVKPLKEILKISGISKFIDKMPHGLDTPVGENGKRLSGGQRQRIAIARALAQDSKVLILDEGTSVLDSITGLEIEKTLLEIEDVTLITITHKMNESILSQYDEIIVMDKGIVVEKGSFQELLSLKKCFYQLYRAS